MDDETLLKGIKEDDQSVFQLLFEKYARYAAAVAAKVGDRRLSVQDVEEICSDVFITLWTKRNTLVLSGGTLKPYIGTLAKNKALNMLRDRKALTEIGFEETTLSSASSETDYLQQESADELITAINTLEPLDRELFIRRYFYQERVTDIAKSKRLNVKTASARIRKARQHLELTLVANETEVLK